MDRKACGCLLVSRNETAVYNPPAGVQMSSASSTVRRARSILSSLGIPTGLQIVGRTVDDLSVFRAAAAFEAARPWRNRRPSL
jgi:Asp-tRNA(Asn)/Glu-tRNA(Gln) amidotransferase A subunit family amidase